MTLRGGHIVPLKMTMKPLLKNENNLNNLLHLIDCVLFLGREKCTTVQLKFLMLIKKC